MTDLFSYLPNIHKKSKKTSRAVSDECDHKNRDTRFLYIFYTRIRLHIRYYDI